MTLVKTANIVKRKVCWQIKVNFVQCKGIDKGKEKLFNVEVIDKGKEIMLKKKAFTKKSKYCSM